MRKPALILALALTAAPLFAASSGRSQSYFTYDDGGTVIRQAEDGRDIDARVNLPVFPGDEVTTSRRGRAEIRLADGNIIALDRSTTIRFRSILDSYDGDNQQTVVELRAGHVAIERDDETREMLRLDTDSASYAAVDPGTYAVELDGRGSDRVGVFDGSIEVRTPSRTTRIRSGEEARVDDQGIYDLASNRSTADDFERWFLGRSQHYRTASSRYLDRSLAYYDDELSSNGSWQFVAGYNSWAWRPRVAVGWRPYYYGHWYAGPSGCLNWVSYEPWGWVPYHYGRWAYDPFYGWVWLPGIGYSPAWVYWMYGPSYVGWAPMGWYDCYRPYYDWAYRPYARIGFGFNYGWYGRVHVGNVDLRPWTFVQPNALISRRVDQAAISTEIVRGRLLRDGGSFATVTPSPARFSRNEIKDPTAAVGVIARHGIGSGTGKEGSGVATVADMTPFFRRDPELSNTIRERVARTYRNDTPLSFPVGSPSGVPSPGTAGTLEGRVPSDNGGRTRSEVGQGGTVNRGGGTVGDAIGGWRRDTGSSTQPQPQPQPDRGSTVRRDDSRTSPSNNDSAGRVDRGDWRRDRVLRPSTPSNETQTQPAQPADHPPTQDWRGRTIGRRGGDVSRDAGSSPSGSERGGAEVPRRIIDSIGGGRVYSGDRDRGTVRESTPRESTPRDSNPPRSYSPPPPRDNGGHVERSSPPPEHHSPPPSSSSSSSSAPKSHDGGDGGRVKRN